MVILCKIGVITPVNGHLVVGGSLLMDTRGTCDLPIATIHTHNQPTFIASTKKEQSESLKYVNNSLESEL